MQFVNNLSIKHKLLFLVFVPLTILITISVWKIDQLHNDIADLSSIDINLNAGKKVMAHLLIADKLRLNILKKSSVNPNQQLLDEALHNSKQVMLLSDSLMIKLQQNNQREALLSFISNFNNMDEAFTDVKDFDQQDIDEWSSWIIEDIVFELFISLEKLNVHTDFNEINQKITVVNQLRWIMLYALQENWFIQLMLERGSFDELVKLRMISVKEEIVVGRFLSLNANKKQIELLLNTFQKDDFQKSLSYKENMLSRNIDFFSTQPKDKIEAVLNNRLSLMMDMSQSIISNTNKEITTSIHEVKNTIYYLMFAIVLLIILISILGFNLINRIFIYLKSTIMQLEKIESENDYTLLISEDGKDEFSHFSSKLNLLIAERKINIDKMIQSKEDAEKANKAKSYFLANMSHEIRTPLNGILGMYEILATTELSHSQKNYLETINLSSKTLLMLINDILDISKIESGKLILSESCCQFREALYETVSMISAKAVEKRLKLSVDIDPQLPTYLQVDEHRLRQIVMNLLSNALKFTEKGSIALMVSGEQKADRFILTIKVKDSGIGIKKENQATIFKPFVQEDGSITREFGGTGLGLAISTQLVQLMGGDLNCNSEKGKGSCFYFYIDVMLAELKEQAPLTTDIYKVILIDSVGEKAEILARELKYLAIEVVQIVTAVSELATELSSVTTLLYCQADLSMTQHELKILATNYSNSPVIVVQQTDDQPFDFREQIDGQIMIPLLGKRCLNMIKDAVTNHVVSEPIDSKIIISSESNKLPVLLVEDNLVNQKVASFFLKRFGFEFEIAGNGLIALEAIKNGGAFSIILMDCMMPVMDGFTATKEIRCFEKENKLNKVPIIALTASIFEEDIKHCYEVGMDDYLAKPIDKEAFENKIKQYANAANSS